MHHGAGALAGIAAMGRGSGGGAGLSRSNRQNPWRDRRLENREQKRIGDRVEELAKALKAKDVMLEDMKKEKVETEQVLEKMKQTIATMQGTVSNSRDHQTEMSRIQKEFLAAKLQLQEGLDSIKKLWQRIEILEKEKGHLEALLFSVFFDLAAGLVKCCRKKNFGAEAAYLVNMFN